MKHHLCLKTEGELQGRVKRWIWHGFSVFLVLYLLTTIMALLTLMLVEPGAEIHGVS